MAEVNRLVEGENGNDDGWKGENGRGRTALRGGWRTETTAKVCEWWRTEGDDGG
uniref:Uncharacterized protein n=1 Tax=Cucumis melo TaxID=3656 RepID=A0A9I9E1C5_CUCME